MLSLFLKKASRTVVACARAICSTSQHESVTVCCFLDLHDIKGPVSVKLKQYPLILRLPWVEDSQSASLNQSTSNLRYTSVADLA